MPRQLTNDEQAKAMRVALAAEMHAATGGDPERYAAKMLELRYTVGTRMERRSGRARGLHDYRSPYTLPDDTETDDLALARDRWAEAGRRWQEEQPALPMS